jgi:hypothetical protein
MTADALTRSGERQRGGVTAVRPRWTHGSTGSCAVGGGDAMILVGLSWPSRPPALSGCVRVAVPPSAALGWRTESKSATAMGVVRETRSARSLSSRYEPWLVART